MLIDLTRIANSEEKIIQTEVPYEPEVFSSALGEFPIISKTPVSLTIQNKGNQELQGRCHSRRSSHAAAVSQMCRLRLSWILKEMRT